MNSRLLRPLLTIVIAALLPCAAHASALYSEFLGGVSQFSRGGDLYGSAQGTSGLGIALDYGIFYSFSGADSIIEFQMGVQERYSNASLAGTTYQMQAPFLSTRLQVSRLYLGVGIAPLVWATPGGSSFQRMSGDIGLQADLGVLWPVTPNFSLGVVGSATFVKTSAGFSPLPAAEGTVLFRFYLTMFGGGDGSGSNEYKGWRYPLGSWIGPR